MIIKMSKKVLKKRIK